MKRQEGKTKTIDKQMLYFVIEIVLIAGVTTLFCIYRKEVIGFIKMLYDMGLVRPWM